MSVRKKLEDDSLKLKAKPKVFVGLSGGVDSSVAAALLKKAGYEVTGIFIKAWHPSFLPCDWIEDRRDAMRVCAALDIPFLTFDLEKEYKKEVVDYMIAEYKKGRTPNPDVMCNKEIKFGHFLKKALSMGADFVATGHYARIVQRAPYNVNMHGTTKKLQDTRYTLQVSCDSEKDQTYFLLALNQRQLSKILFPIGKYEKRNVRKLAEKLGLPTAHKKDSQGLCFLGKVDMKEFLAHYIKPKEGKVLALSGKVVGAHPGAVFFTIGERHGFEIDNKKTNSRPLYVVAKNINKNTITVSDLNPESAKESQISEFKLSDVNWINETPKKGKIYKARGRYRQKLFNVKIEISGKMTKAKLLKPMTGITPGQSLVVYDGKTCLGGGIIN